MFCSVCKNLNLKNTMSYATSTITRHVECGDHKQAISAPKEQVNMEQAVKNVLSKEEKAVTIAMKSVYFLVKLVIPLTYTLY